MKRYVSGFALICKSWIQTFQPQSTSELSFILVLHCCCSVELLHSMFAPANVSSQERSFDNYRCMLTTVFSRTAIVWTNFHPMHIIQHTRTGLLWINYGEMGRWCTRAPRPSISQPLTAPIKLASSLIEWWHRIPAGTCTFSYWAWPFSQLAYSRCWSSFNAPGRLSLVQTSPVFTALVSYAVASAGLGL